MIILPEQAIEKLAAEAWLASSYESHMSYFNALAEVVTREMKKTEEQTDSQEKLQISEWHLNLGRFLPRCVVRFLRRTQVEFSKRKYYLSKYPLCLRPYIKTCFCYNYQTPTPGAAGSAAEMMLPKTETNQFSLTNQQDDPKEEETKESKDEMPVDMQVSGMEKEVNHTQQKQPISKWQMKFGQELPRCIMRFLNSDRKIVAYGMRKYYLPLYPRFHKP